MCAGIRLVLVFVLGILLAAPAFAEQQQQRRPDLNGISPLKAYFDVNLGIAKSLDTRLMLINTTYEQLLQRGARPEFIVGFRGKASSFVTKGEGYVEAEDLVVKKKIQQWLTIFKDKGIRLEQCRIAAELTGIDPNDFLSEVEVVDNGYVAMIIYQNQGYSQIPMD